MKDKKVKVAILDMNNNAPNIGLRSIVNLVQRFKELEYKVYNVRGAMEIPDTTYDVYISSGGPGSPLEEGPWRTDYLNLVQELWAINSSDNGDKKFMFFICYSFQVVCDYFQLGTIKLRKSTSFGILPIHKTAAGKMDLILKELDDPYYAVDSRDWQVVQPKLKVFKDHGATILSLEKIRTYVEYERAIMAVRFSDEFIGTQFHPEAEPIGMRKHFLVPSNKEAIVTNYGEEKYNYMMDIMDNPDKIIKTNNVILPTFIREAIKSIGSLSVS